MWSIDSDALEVESFTYNGISSDTLNLLVDHAEISYPEVRERTVILPNRPGVESIDPINPLARYGTRDIKIICGTVLTDRSTESEFRRQLVNKLSYNGEAQLSFKWSSDRIYYAELMNIETSYISDSFTNVLYRVTLTFKCHSPFTYDATGIVTYTDLTSDLVNNADVPSDTILTLTLGAAVAAGDGSIEGTGLVLKIGPNTLQINRALAMGDVLNIGDWQTILNGSSYVIPNMKWSNSYLEVPVGTFKLTSNVAITGKIEMRRRYLE
jgi:phage-related protein